MNDRMSRQDRQQENGDASNSGGAGKPAGRWRSVIRVVVAAVIGFVAVATVHQMLYEPTSSDGTYEWTLYWPGTPPGASFKTQPGDDCRRLLDILLADAGPDWESPLLQQGTIEVRLTGPAYPSLWTILKWRFGLLKGPPTLMAERTVVTVRVNRLTQPSAPYEIVRIDRHGNEVTSGPYQTFDAARGAVLDEVAQAMEEIQT